MAMGYIAGSLTIVIVVFGSSWHTLHVVAAQPRGSARLLAALPVFVAYLLLPYVVDPVVNGVGTLILSAFFSWWANFKVLALCWGRGPLASARRMKSHGSHDSSLVDMPMRFLSFTATLSLPIVINLRKTSPVEVRDRGIEREPQAVEAREQKKDAKVQEGGNPFERWLKEKGLTFEFGKGKPNGERLQSKEIEGGRIEAHNRKEKDGNPFSGLFNRKRGRKEETAREDFSASQQSGAGPPKLDMPRSKSVEARRSKPLLSFLSGGRDLQLESEGGLESNTATDGAEGREEAARTEGSKETGAGNPFLDFFNKMRGGKGDGKGSGGPDGTEGKTDGSRQEGLPKGSAACHLGLLNGGEGMSKSERKGGEGSQGQEENEILTLGLVPKLEAPIPEDITGGYRVQSMREEDIAEEEKDEGNPWQTFLKWVAPESGNGPDKQRNGGNEGAEDKLELVDGTKSKGNDENPLADFFNGMKGFFNKQGDGSDENKDEGPVRKKEQEVREGARGSSQKKDSGFWQIFNPNRDSESGGVSDACSIEKAVGNIHRTNAKVLAAKGGAFMVDASDRVEELSNSVPDSADKMLKEPLETETPWHVMALESLASLLLFITLIYALDYRPWLPHLLVILIYCLLMYTFMLFMFNASAAAMKRLAGLTVAPHFKRPYLSSSLQDFWGHRWNLVAGGTLRDAIYGPMKETLTILAAEQSSSFPTFLPTAVPILTTFFVSGVMHELTIWNAIGHKNGWSCEWLSFFCLHGLLLVAELAVKKAWKRSGRKPLKKSLAIPLTLFILVVTAEIYFFPPVLRNGFDLQAVSEFRRLLPNPPEVPTRVLRWDGLLEWYVGYEL